MISSFTLPREYAIALELRVDVTKNVMAIIAPKGVCIYKPIIADILKPITLR
jgi:hypothetical protein